METSQAFLRETERPAAGSLPHATSVEILRHLGEAAYQWWVAEDRIIWSDNAREVLGLTDAALFATGRAYAALLDPQCGVGRSEAVMGGAQLDQGEGVMFQTSYGLSPRAPGDAQPLWLDDRGRWFSGAGGRPVLVQGVVRRLDASEVTRRNQQREVGAARPVGEGDRDYLVRMLGERLVDAARYRSQFGFLLISIDHLDRLNETYGFEAVDEVIETVGNRLRARMRARDNLGRYSGNKFGIVLNDCSPEDMDVAAARLISAIGDDMLHTSAGAFAVTVTAGGVIAPRHARLVPEIFTRAQDALDAARAIGSGHFQLYQPSFERDARRRLNLRITEDIVAALTERRVSLAFQPIADAGSGRHAFYECLVRIETAEGELLGGATIVPVAEKFGLLRMLDRRVLELALDTLEADPELSLSVNVAPGSVHDRAWLELLRGRMRDGLGARLMVELTESSAIDDIEATCEFVAQLRELGCTVAMDDFGAGYTSFRNLRRLGVDVLKIDGSFIRPLVASEDDRFFVRTLLALARQLRLKTVAEWVPDQSTAALLAEWGCDYLQGEFVGLALPCAPAMAASGVAATA
ncbi:EAL domain-containing protein [Ancylobacter terrae]|uniref:EAL domain-containing protein n=1 Tax=Ancylobacter sp. sgz301288 TaxID=3342077 RepID=UPI003859BB89